MLHVSIFRTTMLRKKWTRVTSPLPTDASRDGVIRIEGIPNYEVGAAAVLETEMKEEGFLNKLPEVTKIIIGSGYF